ncbi:cobalamin biosynthesis protein [Streptomyces sp. HCCB10043]|nr:cobalamin biosynthesis protein [Streptomyces sp. HCCB10043]
MLNGAAGRDVRGADIERAVRLSRRVSALALGVCVAGRLAAGHLVARRSVAGRSSTGRKRGRA